MLDDLQDPESSAAFLDELEEEGFEEDFEEDFEIKSAGSNGLILGMTPMQRFIIAFLLFGITCILSIFCLLVFDKISPPF